MALHAQEAAGAAQEPTGRPGNERPQGVRDEPEPREQEPEKRDLERRMGRVLVDELGQKGQEEECRLRVQHVDHDSLREYPAKPPLAPNRYVGLGVSGEEGPQAERDEIDGPRDLDRGERDRRGEDQRREPGRCGRDVDERPGVDPEHRGQPGTPALVHGASDDVQHGRARDDEQRERGDDEEREPARVRDHLLSSQTSRRPSSVRNPSTSSIVCECGATRSARPPVATTRASAPSSSRMRPTIPSTWPAKP